MTALIDWEVFEREWAGFFPSGKGRPATEPRLVAGLFYLPHAYRIKTGDRRSVMRLATDEFTRRFLIHVLPDGFHRIRHYGLLASAARKINTAKIRNMIGAAPPVVPPEAAVEPITLTLREPCPRCGGPMRIIEIFRRGQKPQSRAPPREMAA